MKEIENQDDIARRNDALWGKISYRKNSNKT